MVPSATVACWSCDTPNNPSRMFCVECGSFIAVGSKTKAVPPPASGAKPAPAASPPLPVAPLAFDPAAMPLSPYALAMQRKAKRRSRTLTAVTSVALALVIGAGAIYVAAPFGEPAGEPTTAVVAPPTASTLPAHSPDEDVLARDESPHTPIVEEATTVAAPVAGVQITEPESEPGVADIDPDPDPDSELEPEVADIAVEPDPEPETPSEPILDAAVEPAASEADDPITVAIPAEPAAPAEPATPARDDSPVIVNGWVCDGEVQIEDRRVRDWSLGRVSFRVRPGYERVVLHLERIGTGSGDPASVTAGAVPTSRVRTVAPAVRKPTSGRTTVGLRLADGIKGELGLRGYRPSGMAVIKELSVYRAAGRAANVLISADNDGCFRVRVPAWNDPSGSVRRAEIVVDIKS
jgi:hypothetical protein